MRNWTEEEVTLLLYEYCRRPFGQFSSAKPFVKDLAKLLGRNAGAIVRKAGNLASFDPLMKIRGVSGLCHASKVDSIIWDRYYGRWDTMAYDAECILARLREKPLEVSVDIDLTELPVGSERVAEVKRRINQNFFRDAVLSSYSQRCCITGLNNPELLNACHIVNWSESEAERTDPENGLCMDVFFHQAYDRNLIGISPDYEIFVSDHIMGQKPMDQEGKFGDYLMGLRGRKIILPRRFSPNRDLLALHFERYRHTVA